MLELKFTIKEIEELVEQGDANYLDEKNELVRIYQNLYRINGDYYYNVQQKSKRDNLK